MRFLFTYVTVFITTSCGDNSQNYDSKTLHLGVYDHPYSYNPQKSFDMISNSIVALLYEGLTRQTSTNRIELALAERVEVAPDQKCYIFYLKNTMWSDGQKVTAYDFERSWKSHLDPDSTAFNVPLFFEIKNAKNAKKGIVSLDEVGIKALDEKRLRVDLLYPMPYFLELTAHCAFFPFRDRDSTGLVTNGAFRLKKEKLQDYIILEANPHYYDNDSVKIKNVRIDIIKDEDTSYKLFLQGKLDYIGDPFSRIPLDSLNETGVMLKHSPTATTACFIFNLAKPSFNNIHIRRAISGAIDREEIVRSLAPFPAVYMQGVIPSILKNTKSFEPDLPIYDPKSELEIGLKELQLKHLQPIKITFPNSEVNKTVALIVQSQLKRVLDIHIEIEGTDLISYIQKSLKNDFDVLIGRWIAAFNDPISLLDGFSDKDDPKNYSKWDSLDFQSLILEAKQTHDNSIRARLFDLAEQVISQDLPVFTLFQYDFIYLLSNRLEGVFLTPNGTAHFSRATINNKIETPSKVYQ